jgi:hypothetical protein
MSYSDKEFLEAVRDRLLEKGWHSGRLGGPDGPNCLVGAAIWTDPPEGIKDGCSEDPGVYFVVNGEDFVAKDDKNSKRLARLLGRNSVWDLIWAQDTWGQHRVIATLNEAINA